MKIIACLITLTLIGCCPFLPKSAATAYATPRVKPYIKALDSYHEAHNTYPASLDALHAAMPQLGSKEAMTKGDQWSIGYTFVDHQNYRISCGHAHYHVYYENGKHKSTYVNCWR